MGLLLVFSIGLAAGLFLLWWMSTPKGKRWMDGY